MNLKLRLASLSLLSASLCAFAPSAHATAITPNQTFYFTGTCSDCTGYGNGTLVLQNYTPGTALNTSNFVSFNYTSNLLPAYSFAGDTIQSFSGSIAATTGPDNVNLLAKRPAGNYDVLNTSLSGGWCTGQGCLSDQGTNGIFSQTAPPISSTPEPATLSLLGTGIAGILALRRRRK